MEQIVTFDPLILNPPINAKLITDVAGLELARDFLINRAQGVFGFDLETNVTKDFYWRKVRTIQFGGIAEQYVIDMLAFAGSTDTLRDEQGQYGSGLTPGTRAVIDMLTPFLCSAEHVKVGINLAFEYLCMYWNFGLRTYGYYCCDLAERVIAAGDHSLKDFSYFSMEEMIQRYFQKQIDKELQTSFDLETPLTQAQTDYAAIDTRVPLALRTAQMRIAKRDGLCKVTQIENDCIGAFVDMHVHGDRLNPEKWLARLAIKKAELVTALEGLDKILIPIVGSKYNEITEEEVEAANQHWKTFNVISTEEIVLKGKIRSEKDPSAKSLLEQSRLVLETSRKETKEQHKEAFMTLRKKRTVLNTLRDKCAGAALLNYGSPIQLLDVLKKIKGLESIESTGDDVLSPLVHIPIVKLLSEYRSLSKEVNTYGEAWAQTWTTGPIKEEGFLHPADGKLHCVFTQLAAETGRPSSSKPNALNLPRDEKVRACFEADPPNENIRVSLCCNADTHAAPFSTKGFVCITCGNECDTRAEDYVLITADMSGAELRILTELALDPVWLSAFINNEDVHSICTGAMYPQKWKTIASPGCKYFALKPDGNPMHLKCKCPAHNELRNNTKSTNFLLVNGGGPKKLSIEIGSTLEEAKKIMDLHKQNNPIIWAYLDESGQKAKTNHENHSMFGRRRLFPEPTWERATKYAMEENKDQMEYSEEEQERNLAQFVAQQGRKPNKDEKYLLTHRKPTSKEISKALRSIQGGIERQGKNNPLQATNADIAKLAMGSGKDAKQGLPYLFHIFPKFRAKLIKMIYDELVIQAPSHHAETVALKVKDAFKRAGAEVFKYLIMETEYNIAKTWLK